MSALPENIAERYSAIDPTMQRTDACGPIWNAAKGFSLLALLIVVAGAAVLLWFGRQPTLLVWSAGTIALYGVVLSGMSRRGAQPETTRWAFLSLSAEGWCALSVFSAFLAFYAVTSGLESPYNEPVRQAVAFLHGHTYIDAPVHSYIEYAEVGAYKYALHPPMAAILLMPLAAIWGMQTPQTAFCVVVGALDAALVWCLLGRLKLNLNAMVWLTLFFCVGTDFWFDVISGNTWSLPMVISVFFTVAALAELFGEARPFWLGVLAALACLTRYDLALAAPVYPVVAWLRGRRIKELLWMAPGFVAVGLLFVGLNEARFHSLFDLGVSIEAPKGSPAFSLRYLPANLYTIFFIAPGGDGRFPYIHPTFMGQAIPLTSPAFALAFRSSFRRIETHLLWIAAVAGSIPSLLCYATGYAQFGTRHYIQVFPFLLVLMALGTSRRADQLTKVLIAISIFLISFGVWHIKMWGYG